MRVARTVAKSVANAASTNAMGATQMLHLAAVLAFAVTSFVLFQLYSVRVDVSDLQGSLLALLRESEGRAPAGENDWLRQEEVPKGGKSSGELDTVAVVREFIHNFDSSDVPKVEYLNTLDQEHPVLVEYVRKQMLIPPAANHLPYNLAEPHKYDPSQGQTMRILEIFKNKTYGTFLECGALDAESISNSLTLERNFNWTGVLIEADPDNFKTILSRNRKAWMVPTCLSLKKTPQMVAFAKNIFGLGKIENEKSVHDKSKSALKKLYDVHCLPLTSILMALNQTSIDYFSLDIEGHELDVLRTIDFKKIDIKVLAVEFAHGAEPKENMRTLMEENGYRVFPSTDEWAVENYVFIKQSSGL